MSLASVGAAQGMQAALQYFGRFAASVTRAAAQLGDSTSAAGSPADLIDGMVGMNLAGAAIKANISVFRTADEMLGSLLDMHA